MKKKWGEILISNVLSPYSETKYKVDLNSGILFVRCYKEKEDRKMGNMYIAVANGMRNKENAFLKAQDWSLTEVL